MAIPYSVVVCLIGYLDFVPAVISFDNQLQADEALNTKVQHLMTASQDILVSNLGGEGEGMCL